MNLGKQAGYIEMQVMPALIAASIGFAVYRNNNS
jgi:hypothetical protein